LKKIENQRAIGSSYLKNLEKLVVFMKELAVL
jgi:hypothetical protein